MEMDVGIPGETSEGTTGGVPRIIFWEISRGIRQKIEKCDY